MIKIKTNELSEVTGLTAERLRQLAASGHYPKPVRGEWDFKAVVSGLVGYLSDRLKSARQTPETITAKEQKAIADAQMAKLKLAEKQGAVLDKTEVERTWAAHIVRARHVLQRSSLHPAELKKVLAELEIAASEYEK